MHVVTLLLVLLCKRGENGQRIPRLCAPQIIRQAEVTREEMTQMCLQLACPPMLVQTSAKTQGHKINLRLARRDESGREYSTWVCSRAWFISVCPCYLSCIFSRDAPLSVSEISLLSRLVFLSQEHLGWAEQISAPGFWASAEERRISVTKEAGISSLAAGERTHSSMTHRLFCSRTN